MRRALGLAPAGLVLALVLWRAVAHPVDTYGDSGAGYIEHLERVRVLSRLLAAEGSLLDHLRAADGLYPPGLHLLTAPASFLGAHVPASVTALGPLWLALLAGGVAACARVVDPRATLPAFVATVLTPALHAVAPRYYYDLPMTALVWTAAAALAHAHRHHLAAGVVAAFAFALACWVKWSALPLGLPLLVLGATLGPDRRATVRAAGIALGLGLALVGPTLLASHSFGAMGGATFQPPPGVDLPAWSVAFERLRPGLGHALGSIALQARLDGTARLAFYGQRLLTTVAAPALVVPLLGVALLWARRRAPAAGPVLLGTVPVCLFVLLAVPPLDERFLLTVVPAMGLVTGLALAAPHPAVRPVAVLGAALAIAVAVDFHVGSPDPGPERPATTGHAVPLRWGLSTSIDRRGWARSSDLPDHQDSLRQAILDVVDTCGSESVTGDDALVDPHGDLNWWAFAFERAHLAGTGPRRVFLPFGSGLGPPPTPPTLAFTRSARPPVQLAEPRALDVVLPGVVPRFAWAPRSACPGVP